MNDGMDQPIRPTWFWLSTARVVYRRLSHLSPRPPAGLRPGLLAACLVLAISSTASLGAESPAADPAAAEAIRVLAANEGGLIVHVGCGDGRLTAQLRADDRQVVQGLDSDPARVAAAREFLHGKGLYGPVSVDRWTGPRLPYADNLVNLLVVENPAVVSAEEIQRVLAPGGAACVRRDGGWEKIAKARPEDMDEWTHYLHDASNNAVAADRQVGPPRGVRWIAGPLWSRSHEFNPSINSLVFGGGRAFYILDEGLAGLPDLRFPERWSLLARDAFSGVMLWKRPVPNWDYREWNTRGMWSAPLTLNRRIVTDGSRVFVTLGYNAPITVLDAASGREVRTIEGTKGTDELLLADGMLLACVREQLSVASPEQETPKRKMNPQEWSIGAPGPASIVAIDAESGKEIWRLAPQTVAVLTLAAADGLVCFQGDNCVVAVDQKSGAARWSTDIQVPRGNRHAGGTLVLHEGVVLFAASDGLTALDGGSGQILWSSARVSGPGVTQPADVFVAGGLVWTGDTPGEHSNPRTAVRREGRDPRTGEVKRTIDVENLISPLHHFRCYRSKATDRFLLLTKRGVEFLDLEDDEQHMRHDWLRAMCHYGFVPCNGLLYVPPHHCFCYPGVKLTGFLALSAESGVEEATASNEERLERGPAFGPVQDWASPPAWPTYRRDPRRSGFTPEAVPAELAQAWESALGGKVTQVVVAGDRLFAAQVDAHRVCCLDAGSGQLVWSFTAGGRIDSVPTLHQGRVLFGCRDGWIYCLRAADGQLAWRFRAAPGARRVVAFNQVESAWPVPGSVLVLEGVAYAACGHSSFLDGGVRLVALDPKNGRLLHETCVEGPWPDVDTEVGRPFDMEGVKSDVLVTDGTHVFLFQMTFDKQLRQVEAPRLSDLGDRQVGRHLIATGGFLDETWYDRTYWMHSERWPGFYYANDAPKAGQILVFDEDTTFGLHVFTKRLRLSPAFTPGAEGYELFADANDNEPVLAANSINREKGPGYSRAAPPKWSVQVPVRARAMVLAGDTLFLAGPPDVVPEGDPYAAFDGRLGARLWAVSAADGTKLAEYALDRIPAFDGLVAASGRLYLTTTDGSIRCYAGK